jgi:hypothetical protein
MDSIIISTPFLNNQDGKATIGFRWFMIETNGRLFSTW